MSTIATLEIIQNIAHGRSKEMSIAFYCTSKNLIDISEESAENEALVEKLTKGIPPYNETKRKNVIINHVVSQGLRMITATSTTLHIDSNGEVGQARIEIYFELL